jgi:hypothetical protein
MPRSPKKSLPLMFSNKRFMWISLFPVRATYPAHLILYGNSAVVQIIEVLRVFFSSSLLVISVRFKYHPRSFVLKYTEYNLFSYLLKGPDWLFT